MFVKHKVVFTVIRPHARTFPYSFPKPVLLVSLRLAGTRVTSNTKSEKILSGVVSKVG